MTTQVQHTRELAKRIHGAVAITGSERGAIRQNAYKRLAEKRLMCIVSNVINEGIDIPTLDVGINADGGQDSRRIFQRMRMMTPAPGKTRGTFVDFIHEEKHLSKHSKRRLEFYNAEPMFNVQIRDFRTRLIVRFRNLVALSG